MLIGQHGYEEVHLMLPGELQRLRQRLFCGFDVISREQEYSTTEPRRDCRSGCCSFPGNFICPRLRRSNTFIIAERRIADADHHAAEQRSLGGATTWRRCSSLD